MEIKRLIETKLKNYIEKCGAVLISGPKFCGKTYLAIKYSNSQCFITSKSLTNETLDYDYNWILNGETPRLIDEWQNVWPIWDKIKQAVDISYGENGKKGLYILTGSTKPYDRNTTLHSGAGRIFNLKMSTLTFCEILNLDDNQSISLSKLSKDENEFKSIFNPLSHDEVNNLMLRGGWPSIYSRDDSAEILVKSYIELIITRDAELYKYKLNKLHARNILKSLARLNGSQLNKQTVIKDTNIQMRSRNLDDYLELFYDVDLIFNVEPWTPKNLRSSFAIRTKPKTYFCDTSISCSLCSINILESFRMDLRTTGIIFENQVMKDLMVYADCLDAKLHFYRDEKGNEIDAIMQHKDGSWWAIEIKLSEDGAIRAAAKLSQLSEKLITAGNHTKPSLKLVITDSEKTLHLENGVYIIPHTLIRP